MKAWAIPTIASSVVVGITIALISWGITANREEPVAETVTHTPPASISVSISPTTITISASPTAKRLPFKKSEGRYSNPSGHYGYGVDSDTIFLEEPYKAKVQAIFGSGTGDLRKSAQSIAEKISDRKPSLGEDSEWSTTLEDGDIDCRANKDGDDVLYWKFHDYDDNVFMIYP